MPRRNLNLELGPPSDRSAVIANGLHAHATMLYPFVAEERLDGAVRAILAGVARRHAPIHYRLAGAAEWPGVTYVAVDPVRPFVALQADIGRAFPGFPLYGPEFTIDFVPHVTIDEDAPRVPLDDRAWRSLPHPAVASAIEVIARPVDGRWRTVWRIGLGGQPGSTRR